MLRSLLAFLLCGLVAVWAAHGQFGFGRGAGPVPADLVSRFDANHDGKLDDHERPAAREYLRSFQGGRGISTSGTSGRPIATSLEADLASSAASAPLGKPDLYDELTLRSLYLRFPSQDWMEELADFYDTGVDVSADLVVDGSLYRSVGVRYRGNSSYRMVGGSLKKSFDVSVDYGDAQRRLLGYRTLNLLNANADPSLMREVLFSRVSRSYLPALKANFVKLYINGESWGIYVNVEQFNNDFVKEWFGSTGGMRWKVPAGGFGGGRAGAGLAYLGSDPERYRGTYEPKSAESPEAWQKLIRLCEVLSRIDEDPEGRELEEVLDVDAALWYLALENVFIDSDGYLSRGSDFALYQDASGRFHLVGYDNNETFNFAGRGGPNSWPSSEPNLSPMVFEGSSARPLVNRLLSVPALRARYVAHLSTIVDEWLDWRVLGPLVSSYRALIEADVKADTKSLYGYQAFVESLGGSSGGSTMTLERFVTERRAYLLRHPELRKAGPRLESVALPATPEAGNPVSVTARLGAGTLAARVLLWYTDTPDGRFRSVPMRDAGARIAADLGAELPAFPAGSTVRYYVEARGAEATSFWPARAQRGALSFTVAQKVSGASSVLLNEIMALNRATLRDPQMQFDDWIELVNNGPTAVDLGGMYLSDRDGQPRMWAFPAGTVIPARGYLLVWADEDAGSPGALHANFKLAGGGETVLLVDSDARLNAILDRVSFGAQSDDVALGRYPDGTGAFRQIRATPGRANVP